MSDRPYTLLSCAMSVDGYIDDASGNRLMLSNDADLDRVDALRAECDAILVGAATIRADDPRLVVRSPDRRASRTAARRTESPTKVTLTSTGSLDPSAQFFTVGTAEKLVYCASHAVDAARSRLGAVTSMLDAGEPVALTGVLADLAERGVRTLLVEGGSSVHTQFLTEGLADELRLAVAPFFVGDHAAPRFVGSGAFPHTAANPMHLSDVRRLGDVVVLRYRLGDCQNLTRS